jgi:1-acyl-sn-glycerol-3-phosphate acyltransferase
VPKLLNTESKYRFVPPHEGDIWPRLIGRITPAYLRRRHGITQIEVRGEEIICELQGAGHGILLAPNHCRMSDAIVLQSLANQLRQPFFMMASAHLFSGSRLLAWTIRRCAFSINREGIDRQAIQKALTSSSPAAARWSVPGRGASHSNEHLNPLQEG